MKCDLYPDQEATVKITYGLYSEYEKGRPHYKVNFCSQAAKELWEKSKELVSLQLMHWKNEPPG